MPALTKNGLAVVLERIVNHHGFFSRRCIVTRVALSTALQAPVFTSSVGALIEVSLAFWCKDCESVFVVFAVGNHEEVSFLESVEVE